MLDHPYALNYTTAPSHGERRVSGTVTVAGGNAANVVVGLADGPLLGEPEGIVKIAIVVSDPAGTYSYSNVRDGVYWPVAVKDADGDGQFDPNRGDPFGEYDRDGDGHADSIVISGSDRSGIDIVLRPASSVPTERPMMPCLDRLPEVTPNPLYPMATIRFSLARRSHVRLCMFNPMGDQVGCLLDETCVGSQTVTFEARDLPDGVYFYRLMAGQECRTGKVIVCR
jgi:hypothetical protein